MKFHVVIPARFDSVRLPGKPLADVYGRALILRTADCARACVDADVIVATDDERIASRCRDDGLAVEMTSASHRSGTDRIAEVARNRGWGFDEIVVNVQGDEPCIPSQNIYQVAELLDKSDTPMATLAEPIQTAAEYEDPNCVKVVCDAAGKALYFSRATIPFVRDNSDPVPTLARRHIGIYAYRVGALVQFAETPACTLEKLESLEQLRALWMGWSILVDRAKVSPQPGVDTREDLDRARDYYQRLSESGN